MTIKIVVYILIFCCSISVRGQSNATILSIEDFDSTHQLFLVKKEGWFFKSGNDLTWSAPDVEMTDWQALSPADLNVKMLKAEDKLEGWFRFKFRLDESLRGLPLGLMQNVWAASDIYLDGIKIFSFGNTGTDGGSFREHLFYRQLPVELKITPKQEHLLAIHFVDDVAPLTRKLKSQFHLENFIILTGPGFTEYHYQSIIRYYKLMYMIFGVVATIAFLCWLIFLQNKKETHLLLICITISLLFLLSASVIISESFPGAPYITRVALSIFPIIFFLFFIITVPLVVSQIFRGHIQKWHWLVAIGLYICTVFSVFFY